VQEMIDGDRNGNSVEKSRVVIDYENRDLDLIVRQDRPLSRHAVKTCRPYRNGPGNASESGFDQDAARRWARYASSLQFARRTQRSNLMV
jgi:hypothetical protein